MSDSSGGTLLNARQKEKLEAVAILDLFEKIKRDYGKWETMPSDPLGMARRAEAGCKRFEKIERPPRRVK